MALEIVPLYQYYTIWPGTKIEFYMWGWTQAEGCPLFVSPIRANSPGLPPAVKLENGIVHEDNNGTLVRRFIVSGHRWDGQTAPQGGVMIYAILDIPAPKKPAKKPKKKISPGAKELSHATVLHKTDGTIVGVGLQATTIAPHLKIEIGIKGKGKVLASKTTLPVKADIKEIPETLKFIKGNFILKNKLHRSKK